MTKIKVSPIRSGSTAALALANPVLARGELCYDTTEHSIKCGDGAHHWSELEAHFLPSSPERPCISIERLREYLYCVSFDKLPESSNDNAPYMGACSSYVSNGKLYRNFDYPYDELATFILRAREFVGTSVVPGLTDSHLDNEKIAQLPYRLVDGSNNNGIMLSVHLLFNDWQWNGCGEKSIPLTSLPYEILSRVKSMATISTDLAGVLDNLALNTAMGDYLLQVLVTDGTTTYAVIPPTSANQPYEVVDATSNPKMTNFRWVADSQVERAELQNRPTGVERFNAMPCDLQDLRFTKAYESADRLSEFIGIDGTTKDSTDAELEAIYAEARAEYLQRERDGKTWHTMHSVVYGDKMLEFYIQENWEDNIISGASVDLTNYRTKEEQDAIDAQLAKKDGYYQTLSAGYADKAGNLDSWETRDESPVENESKVRVRTTAGDESINGKAGATLLSFICHGADYIPTRIISSGVNLLRLQSNNGLAVALGDGWYFPVPKLTATNDSIGTTNENNGVLFVDSEGNNLTPTVRFKALVDGVPTSLNDGVVATYLDKNGRSHYTTSGDGYLIVSGITHASTCARIAWSTDYDKFISPASDLDAGTIKSLTGIGTLRSVGLGGILVSDKAERISDTQMRKTVNVGTSTNLTWTDIQEIDSEGEPTGNYTHTATIAGMLIGGVADIKLSGASEFFALTVEGNTVSFVDSNETVASGYTVKYQLEVPTTSNVNVGSVFANISDWGVEYLEASGEGAILWQYAQGIPDSVYGLLAKRESENRVIAEALVNLNERLTAIETMIDKGFPSLKVDDLTIARALFARIALGDILQKGTVNPTSITPAGVVQFYHNTANNTIWMSVGSESPSNWLQIK